MAEEYVLGDQTSKLQEIFNKHANNQGVLPTNQIASVMPELGLSPSRAQVEDMVRCASRCGHRQLLDHIKFTEFAVLVTELQDSYKNCQFHPISESNNKSRKSCHGARALARKLTREHSSIQVFLGGSCNPTTWRKDTAIPFLKSLNITFYNPQVPHWEPELLEVEDQAKEASEVLFFVVDNETRGVSSIIEISYYAGSRRAIIVVLKPFQRPGVIIRDEPLSKSECEELNNTQTSLQDLLERQCIPVFSDIYRALVCTSKVLQECKCVQELTAADGVQAVCYPHLQVGKRLITLRESFFFIDSTNSGFLDLNELCLAYRSATSTEFNPEWLDFQQRNKGMFTFEEFCCIWVEFRLQASHRWPMARFIMSIIMDCILRSVGRIFLYTLSVFGFSMVNLKREKTGKEVYLGGTCMQSDWKREAITLIRKHGVTYYECLPSTLVRESAQENCKVLLYVIPPDARALFLMAEASYFIGRKKNLVLCVKYLSKDVIINGSSLSVQAVKDYNRGRTYLSDIANRESVPVFDDVTEAVHCVIAKVKASAANNISSVAATCML
ncbi:PREDICTED: uncharacterized protein LOC106804877 [Priapulus caudatus]|uniref:Uncharacterized protein LOC106804877 n=1 Tax=Priapulus caudatus TaxID=37621 RepID=A0ABM1DP71_PRICU|nr:PREDICTED: uncharacterized protein LOC106804877 [Priapulus caudatus]